MIASGKFFFFKKAIKSILKLLKIILALYVLGLRLTVAQRYKTDEAALFHRANLSSKHSKLSLCFHAAVAGNH